jgi:hypothetical protein
MKFSILSNWDCFENAIVLVIQTDYKKGAFIFGEKRQRPSAVNISESP